ncbi:MAG: phage head-tail connector protein [Rhodovulum sp.]|nr:phage head-tail connector protein [Rhodovulum sp.]
MTPVLITAPTVPLVSLDDAKRHLRVDHSDDDVLITGLVAAVAAKLDPALGGVLGRALRPATWELRFPHFPCGKIELPYPPCTAIASIEYDGFDGITRTLAEFIHYRVFLRPLDRSFVTPIYGGSWPSARGDYESVRIRYTAGYAIAGSEDSLPAAIKEWVLLQIGTLYEHRETVVTAPAAVLPADVDTLILPFRVFG